MGGGLFGSSKSQTQVPAWLEAAMRRNVSAAEQAGQVGFVPYSGPTVAGFTPDQTAAMGNTNAAAAAFGLVQGGAGVPAPQQFAGGFSGYSAMPLYEAGLAGIDPAQRALIEGQMAPAPVAPQMAPVAPRDDDGGYVPPMMPRGTSAGYTGFADMFDGGGPGASGDTFQGGGLLSDFANVRAARRAG